MKKSPHHVDVHVGARIRQQRTLLGMSQEKLGQAVGITFQQIQKYEKGSNRIGASRMWQFAQALGVPVASFFEGLPESGRGKKVAAPEVDPGMLTLAKHFKALKSPVHRDAVCSLARSLAA